jgi:hypothetical protein
MENTNREFVNHILGLSAAIRCTEFIPSPFTVEDSEKSLRSLQKIADLVVEELRHEFPNRQMNQEELASVLDLERAMKAIRGAENLRIDAMKKFSEMTAGAAQ